MKRDRNYFFLLVACLSFFAVNDSYAAPPIKHCQPQDVACLQSMNSNIQPSYSKTPIRKYDAAGRVIIERVGGTTTYYTYDEKGEQHQQYKEKVVTKTVNKAN